MAALRVPSGTLESVLLDGSCSAYRGHHGQRLLHLFLLGASIHPLLLRKQGRQRDLPNPREAIFVGSLINQAVESQEKTGQLRPCFL